LKQSLGAIRKRYVTLKKRYYPSVAFPLGKQLHALVNSKPMLGPNAETFKDVMTRQRIFPTIDWRSGAYASDSTLEKKNLYSLCAFFDELHQAI